MERDRAMRVKKARVDDLRRQNAVATAREHVYAGGRAVSGAAVEKILGEQSRVPTLVRHFTQLNSLSEDILSIRTRFPPGWRNLDSTFTKCSRQT